VTFVLDYEDMVANAATFGGRFRGMTTSKDKGIFVAALGPSENDLTEVTVIMRVRNKVDPGSSPARRAGQRAHGARDQ
jgi:hypothetical protein